MKPLAQTNLQLYRQLEERSYPTSDIEHVRDAYTVAMRLFAGQYRPTGKTFLAHVAGTASALVETRAPAKLVAAALLHSAYTHGDFGTFGRRFDNANRARVRAAIGAQSEAIVYAYGRLAWDAAAVRAFLERADLASGDVRDVVVVRLANEIDDFGDLAGLYREQWQRSVEHAGSFLPLCVQLAERLGETTLAARLEESAHETIARNERLIQTIATGRSVTIAPASYTPGVSARLHGLAAFIIGTARQKTLLRRLRKTCRYLLERRHRRRPA